MTNKTDAEILKNAPDSATHYCCGTYCKANKDFFYDWDGEYWCAYFVPDGDMRSLADIEAIVEKDKKIAELEKENLKALGWIAKAMMQGLSKVDCSDELLKIIAKRDLEQQANGAEYVIESVLGEPETLTSDALSIRYEFLDRLKQLREQAKGGDL